MAVSPIDVARAVAEILDELGVAYALGGSLASSLVGEPRSTVDINMATALQPENYDGLLAAVDADFTLTQDWARTTIESHSSFNLIHRSEPYKVDLFVLGPGLLDTRQLERRRRVVLARDPDVELWVSSAEDQVLRKLSWFAESDGVSDRQWRDVLGILRVQGRGLDFAYLRSTAAKVGLTHSLETALEAAGFDSTD